MNDFSQIDAQNEVSRLAQISPEELTEEQIDNFNEQEYDAYLDWLEQDLARTKAEYEPTEEQKQSILSWMDGMKILQEIHAQIKTSGVLLAGERGGFTKFTP